MKVTQINGKYIHPTLGEGIEDSQGLIWFPISNNRYNVYEALEYAEKLNLRLPTKEEIEYCIKNKFNLGKEDFWSSLIHPDLLDSAWGFNGLIGIVDYDYYAYKNTVRCVIHRSVLFNDKLEEILK